MPDNDYYDDDDEIVCFFVSVAEFETEISQLVNSTIYRSSFWSSLSALGNLILCLKKLHRPAV